SGRVFTLSATAPRTGTSVGVIGFPLGQPKTLTTGTVSGVERSVDVQEVGTVSHLVQIDVPINPGNSGGPVLNRDGQVVGIVESSYREAQGINYAASAAFARAAIEAWRATPQHSVRRTCGAPLGPHQDVVIAPPPRQTSLGEVVMAAFRAYFTAVNNGDYEGAAMRQAPARRQQPDAWAAALSTSFNEDISIQAVAATSTGATAWVTFTSLQAEDKGPRPGETCTVWSIDYSLLPAPDGLLWLDRANGHGGGALSHPCGE
ncbi:MAG: peptidase and chymotrypsin/Hap, partial [Acidimicrobiia bacterium]|nr:peptidase and chymotrypsin/Hap [Acidimicrobiia bacterium]